jgi:hypothetical protein
MSCEGGVKSSRPDPKFSLLSSPGEKENAEKHSNFYEKARENSYLQWFHLGLSLHK